MRFVSCRTCPAAFVIEGASPGERCVLCRVDSTERGQRSAKAGPVAIVRERTSPGALHGYCLGDLQQWATGEAAELGPVGTDEQRRTAAAARRTGVVLDYTHCPSWRAERDNRRATKLVDQPGQRREYRLPVAA